MFQSLPCHNKNPYRLRRDFPEAGDCMYVSVQDGQGIGQGVSVICRREHEAERHLTSKEAFWGARVAGCAEHWPLKKSDVAYPPRFSRISYRWPCVCEVTFGEMTFLGRELQGSKLTLTSLDIP